MRKSHGEGISKTTELVLKEDFFSKGLQNLLIPIFKKYICHYAEDVTSKQFFEPDF